MGKKTVTVLRVVRATVVVLQILLLWRTMTVSVNVFIVQLLKDNVMGSSGKHSVDHQVRVGMNFDIFVGLGHKHWLLSVQLFVLYVGLPV